MVHSPDPNAKRTDVALDEAGESHVFRIDVTDYFDVPPGRFGEEPMIQVTVGLSIPGRHDVPQVVRSSAMRRPGKRK